MKKITFVILLIIIYTFKVQAKEYLILFRPDTTIKKYAAFNKVVVHDLRLKKDYVGSLKAGYKKSPLVPVYQLDSMLEQFGATLIKPASVKEDQELLVNLKQIIVEEKTNGDYTIGNIYFNADFYIGKNDKYIKVYTIDSLFEFAIPDETVRYLTKIYNKLFSGLLVSVSGIHIQQGENTYSLYETMTMDSLEKRKYPIYYQPQQPGIYYSMAEFLNNTPGDTLFVHKHSNNNDVITDKFYKQEEGKRKGVNLADTTCFAIYNGKKWYTPYGKEFKEMKVRNGDFFYMDKAEGLVLASANEYSFMFGGGLLGYVIGNEIANNQNDKHPDRKGKAVFLYKIDAATGKSIRTERLE